MEARDVKVDRPTFELTAPCPCCGQGGPVLATCPCCHAVIAICSEIGTAFRDPRALVATRLDGDRCPACGDAALTDFDDATATDIARIGLAPGDYR
jgi:hypothetical protein